MPGRTPTEAIIDFIVPIQKALNYIAIGRLTFGQTPGKQLGDSVRSISLNDGNPVRLSTPRSSPIFLSTSLWIRMREHPNRREPYSCEVVTYWHTLKSNNGAEIIAFHWTPGAGSRARLFPHIHIGSLVASGGNFMPERVPNSIYQRALFRSRK